VKNVAHGIDKDMAGLLPAQRQGYKVFMKSDFEAILIFLLPYPLESMRHALRITMGTADADSVAPRDRIPGGTGPFNFGFPRHRTNWCSVFLSDFPRRY
jgi:hypothetical protein